MPAGSRQVALLESIHVGLGNRGGYQNGNQIRNHIGNHTAGAVIHRLSQKWRPAPPAVRDWLPRSEVPVDDLERDYPWTGSRDDRFTLGLVLDVGEVLSRHGYPAPTGATLVELTTGLYRALHPVAPSY
jgi:hypothetical protein